MALRYQPELDGDVVELIPSFRPNNSATIVSLWDAGEKTRLPLLRWGDAIFAPVYEGMRFGLEVYNGLDTWVAYPTFIEAANLWLGGPLQPEECSPVHMWELRPHEVMLFDALMDPLGQRGRPIVITQAGFGATVGEATFGTDAFRGQLRIFERHPHAPSGRAAADDVTLVTGDAPDEEPPDASSPPAPRPASGRPASPPPPCEPRERRPPPAPASAAPPPAPGAPAPARAAARAPSPPASPRSAPAAPPKKKGQAGFGAAEEEERRHQSTGVDYLPKATPIVALRTEFREDLEQAIRQLHRAPAGWGWPREWADWRNNSWSWPALLASAPR